MKHLTTFHSGFQSAAERIQSGELFTYKAKNVNKACDQARLRISELNLPLVAIITGHNTFSVKPC